MANRSLRCSDANRWFQRMLMMSALFDLLGRGSCKKIPTSFHVNEENVGEPHGSKMSAQILCAIYLLRARCTCHREEYVCSRRWLYCCANFWTLMGCWFPWVCFHNFNLEKKVQSLGFGTLIWKMVANCILVDGWDIRFAGMLRVLHGFAYVHPKRTTYTPL